MASKKRNDNSPVWVIVSNEGYIDSYPTLLGAQNQAKIYLNDNETVEDVYIFEVTKSWYVEFPPEPEAQVYEMGLDGLP